MKDSMTDRATETIFYAIRRRNTPELVRLMRGGFGSEARLSLAPNLPVYRAKDLMELAEVLNEPVEDWMSSSERPSLGALERDLLEAVKVTETETSTEDASSTGLPGSTTPGYVLVKTLETRIESVEHLLPDARPLKELIGSRRIPAKVASGYVKDGTPAQVLPTAASVHFRIVALPEDTTLEQAMENWPGQQRYFGGFEKSEVLVVAPVPQDYLDLVTGSTAAALILTK